jgi:GNAT superfamily N-acetyltransferase
MAIPAPSAAADCDALVGRTRAPDPASRPGDTALMMLRRAEPVDALAVAGVHVRAWQAAYRGLLPDDYLDALRPEDRAARYTFAELSPDRPLTIVASDAQTICGFATIGPSHADELPRTGELYALYVDPDRWGTGVGRALIKAARENLMDQAFDVASLWVLAGNERAERFYRIDGWTPDGSRREDEVWGVSVDEVRYCRALP